MQASDQYLQVEAVGGFTDFVAAHFNPLHRSFKPAVDNKVFAGFTQHGRALLFQNRKDISIYFNCGAAANELLRSTEPIEIIHEDDAASYYDQLVEGRKIIDDYLVFDAQTQRDLARIKALHEHFKRKYNDPFLQAAIDEFENNPDLEDPMEQSQAQLNTRGMSGTHQTLHDQTNLRELLQHYKKLDESSRSNSEPDPYQIPPSDVFGHSGNLGALDHSITWDREIPMPSNPDPRVYDYMVPKYAPTAVISFRGDTMKLDLSKKTSFSIGRKNSCEIRLVADTVSRQHCRIFQEKDVFWIEDLTSRNGTLVNGLKLQPGTPKQLRSDDIVTVADYSISFRNLD